MIAVSGPSSCLTFVLFKVWTSEKLPQIGAHRVHNALFALVFSKDGLLERRAFWSRALTQWPTRARDFFEELGFAAGGSGNRCNSALVALGVYHCRVRGTLRI
jgi:hypothetical protein